MRSYGQVQGRSHPAGLQLIDAESAKQSAREHLREMGISECAEPGCEKPVRSRSRCPTHYMALLRREKRQPRGGSE